MLSPNQRLSARKRKELERLPKPVRATIMAYVQRGFWYEQLIDHTKHYCIVQLSQYQFISQDSEQCWHLLSIYKIRSNGQPKLARSRSTSPTGVIVERTFIDL